MAHRIPQNVTRADVFATIAQCDELGVDAFLARHGYGPAKRWQLRLSGRSYPSKAILGVAAGLRARDFSGGAAHAVRVLRRLGFHVRDGERRTIGGRLRAILGRLAHRFRFPPFRRPRLKLDPVAIFASGSNRVGAIRGLATIGHDVGVAFPELTPTAEAELAALAGSDVQVFVDSGAFSEVEFGPNGPRVIRPLGDDHWERLLACYERLAAALGDQLHVVAPDMVGHQAATLARLSRYALRLERIAAAGARVLVPMQLGALSQAAFARRVDAVLSFDWIPALPCKKAATTAAQAGSFVAQRRPPIVHLLGLGAGSRTLTAYLEAIAAVTTAVQVQLDSCIIRAMVGRTGGPRAAGGIRRMTAALDLVRTELGSESGLGALRAEAQHVLALGGAL